MDDIDSILFVDDEPRVLSSLRRLLHDEPYRIRTETDPMKAFATVETDPPNVLVADYQMPEMDGLELLRKVRLRDPGIVRLLLTGRSDLRVVARAVNECHVQRYVLKPWDDDELPMILHIAIEYWHVARERDRVLLEVERRHEARASLEKTHRGITKLPDTDPSGVMVLKESECMRTVKGEVRYPDGTPLRMGSLHVLTDCGEFQAGIEDGRFTVKFTGLSVACILVQLPKRGGSFRVRPASGTGSSTWKLALPEEAASAAASVPRQ